MAAYFPAPQLMQTSDPDVALYLPATQSVHKPPSGPVDPLLHLQDVEFGLAAGEYVFVGQDEHAVRPLMSVYLPATQSKQWVKAVMDRVTVDWRGGQENMSFRQ